MSASCRNLIEGLLKKDARQRLGRVGGIDEILAHPWFAGLAIEQLALKRIEPPLRPAQLTLNFDCSEFADTEQVELEKLLFSQRLQGLSGDEENIENDKGETKHFYFEDKKFAQAMRFPTQVPPDSHPSNRLTTKRLEILSTYKEANVFSSQKQNN